MPRYFFHIRGSRSQDDYAGLDLASVEVAQREAVWRAVKELKTHPQLAWGGEDRTIHVLDATGALKFVLTLASVQKSMETRR